MDQNQSRYVQVARRVMVGALLVLPVACGNGDQAAFENADNVVVSAASNTVTATSAAIAETTSPADATAPESSAATSDTATAREVLVSFTYAPSSSGQAKRPYVAVWVEDSDGNLVDTVSLWFEQGGKGTRWLNELQQWYSASDGSDISMSGATRVAGDYTVTWDGTDHAGNPVAQGDYVLYVEAAREHGPYSLTSAPIELSDDGFSVALTDDGELSNISATMVA